MCECCQKSSVAFFDSIASLWDSWHDLKSLSAELDSGLKKFGLQPQEHIMDVGCGTGNLTAVLLHHLSEKGKITAIDISEKMIGIAREKTDDSRVTWICDAVEHLDAFPENTFDRIFCYSVWPHLTDNHYAAGLFFRLLKAGGKLHIWHLISREAVNRVHSEASEPVRKHILVPAQDTAGLLMQAGYFVEEIRDDQTGYLVTARKD